MKQMYYLRVFPRVASFYCDKRLFARRKLYEESGSKRRLPYLKPDQNLPASWEANRMEQALKLLTKRYIGFTVFAVLIVYPVFFADK